MEINKLKIKSGRKISFAVILIIFIIICIGCYTITRSVRNTINNLYQKNLFELAEHDKHTVEKSLNLYWDIIDSVVEDIRFWSNEDGTSVSKLITTDSVFIPNLDSFGFITKDGFFYRNNGTITCRKDLQEICSKVKKLGIMKFSENLGISSDENKNTILFIKPINPIHADNTVFTYVIAFILLNGLEKEFMISSFEGEGWSSISDIEGNFLVKLKNTSHFRTQDNLFDLFAGEEIGQFKSKEELKEKLISNEETIFINSRMYFTGNRKTEPVYVIFVPINDADWYLISAVPTEVYRKYSMKIMIVTFSLLFVILVAACLSAYFIYKQKKIQQEISSEMFDKFSDNFSSVYLVSPKNNSFKIIKRAEYLQKTFSVKNTFVESMNKYVENNVYEAEKELMYKVTGFEYIEERLINEEEFTIRFREKQIDDIPHWMEMTVCRMKSAGLSDFLLGFADRNEEVLKEFINEKMISGYISIYYVNLEKNSFRIIKNPAATDIMIENKNEPWSVAAGKFIEYYCDENSKKEMKKTILDVKMLQKEMTETPAREIMYRWKNEGETWKRVNIHAFERSKGTVTSVVIGISGMDEFASEKQTLSLKLEKALKEVKAASEAKTVFLNNMSHDIRTPMNAILGFTNIARKNINDKAKVEDTLEKVRISGEHLLSLINDVLDMSRIESGTVIIKPVEVNIMTAAEEIYPIFQNLAASKEIDFTISYGSIQNPYVKMDKLHLNQVLINIISNAIKYTNDGGKVEVKINQSAKQNGRGIYNFIIEDNGIGMSQEFQKHVFETFMREETSTVSKKEGTGLGLSIAKKLMDMMDGTITLESEQGKGSTFIVTVPLEILEKFEEQTENTEKKEINIKGKRILLVDDNDFNREIAKETLEENGVFVEEAENGMKAVEAVAEHAPDYYDCVLMDVQMPVMNGYEATERIRKLPETGQRLPIIAVSANAFAEDEQKSIECGMSAHLSKPIKVDELLQTLSSFM